MSNATRLKPLFHPGRLLVTPDALEKLRANQIPVISVMLRHIEIDPVRRTGLQLSLM